MIIEDTVEHYEGWHFTIQSVLILFETTVKRNNVHPICQYTKTEMFNTKDTVLVYLMGICIDLFITKISNEKI
jgi:hypothetical protein